MNVACKEMETCEPSRSNSDPTQRLQQQHQSKLSEQSPPENYFMLLEDMNHNQKMPVSLGCLIENLYERKLQTPAELLIAIIYYIFLESGFIPVALSNELSSKVRTYWGFSFVAQIPDYAWNTVADQIMEQYRRWHHASEGDAIASTETHSEHIYTFKLKLLNHSDDEMQLIVRKIFGGKTLCVTFFLETYEQSTSIVLTVNEFINITENYDFDRIQQNPQQFFLKSMDLSKQVKQTLIAPLRNWIMYENAYPNAALNGLPKEILWLIFNYLQTDLIALQTISQTCVYLRNMTITFLNESNIRLKHRQPTPITYDTSDGTQSRSRYRIYNVYPWIFHPFNY